MSTDPHHLTDEQLDAARAEEAMRLWRAPPCGAAAFQSVGQIAARLAREGWLPPPPVDPDLIEAREVVAKVWDERGAAIGASRTRAGQADSDGLVKIALAALKRGRELAEQERAKS